MLRSLYHKLAAAFLVVLLAYGAVNVATTLVTSRAYTEAVQQRLHRDLARQIVSEEILTPAGEIRREALGEIFHMLMVINPSIEIYLLDPEGRIVDYSAPPERIKRQQVSLEPIEALLSGQARLPLLGDDPRGERRRKVFSAAPIEMGGELKGYLYVILAGEQYESAFQLLAGSQILRLSLWITALGLILAVLAGLGLFHHLTRRLRRLATEMDTFRRNGFSDSPTVPAPEPWWRPEGDEIDRLADAFHRMAGRIVEQVGELKGMDARRRELVANVSHDLRTPLAHIQGYLDTLRLKEESLPPEERREYLEIAVRQSERLGHLVAKLFELAKLDARNVELERETFSLTELAQDVVQKFRLSAQGESICLELAAPRDLLLVDGDLGRIERVLENLIENALRYTPSGGRVDVSLAADDGEIRIEVEDSGPGIAEEELPHIFDRFFRSPGQDGGSGAGLGLAIAKRIVELHGGRIGCESESSRGTTFFVALPEERRGMGTAGSAPGA